MATVHANEILTKFMLLLGGHNHCVKVSSESETVRGMGLCEFSGALRELMLNATICCISSGYLLLESMHLEVTRIKRNCKIFYSNSSDLIVLIFLSQTIRVVSFRN